MVEVTRAVLIEEEAPDGHKDAVEEVLRQAGIDASVEAAYGRRAAGVLPWVIDIAIRGAVASFFIAFGAEAGKDAWRGLKRFVANLRDARTGAGDGTGQVVVRDDENAVVFPSDELPDEAFLALLELDWSEMRGAYLVWRSGEWINATPRR